VLYLQLYFDEYDHNVVMGSYDRQVEILDEEINSKICSIKIKYFTLKMEIFDGDMCK
jgi:hypothetical protein